MENAKHTFCSVNKQLTIFDKNPVVETNAFVNDTWAFPRSTHLIYCFLAPITIPVRILVLIPALLVASFCAWAATLGLDVKKIIEGEAEPMAGWRRVFSIPIKLCGRCLLFTCGVCWISVKVRRRVRQRAKRVAALASRFLSSLTQANLIATSHCDEHRFARRTPNPLLLPLHIPLHIPLLLLPIRGRRRRPRTPP